MLFNSFSYLRLKFFSFVKLRNQIKEFGQIFSVIAIIHKLFYVKHHLVKVGNNQSEKKVTEEDYDGAHYSFEVVGGVVVSETDC